MIDTKRQKKFLPILHQFRLHDLWCLANFKIYVKIMQDLGTYEDVKSTRTTMQRGIGPFTLEKLTFLTDERP